MTRMLLACGSLISKRLTTWRHKHCIPEFKYDATEVASLALNRNSQFVHILESIFIFFIDKHCDNAMGKTKEYIAAAIVKICDYIVQTYLETKTCSKLARKAVLRYLRLNYKVSCQYNYNRLNPRTVPFAEVCLLCCKLSTDHASLDILLCNWPKFITETLQISNQTWRAVSWQQLATLRDVIEELSSLTAGIRNSDSRPLRCDVGDAGGNDKSRTTVFHSPRNFEPRRGMYFFRGYCHFSGKLVLLIAKNFKTTISFMQ